MGARQYYFLGRALLQQKRYPEALDAMEEVRRMAPDSPLADNGTAQVFLAEGQYARALTLMQKQPRTASTLALLSSIYTATGDNKKAFDALREAFDKGYADFAGIDSNPYYSALRSDPRFQELVNKYRDNDRRRVNE